jgi:hypothetical protein
MIGSCRFHRIPKPTPPRVLADLKTPASTLEPGLTTQGAICKPGPASRRWGRPTAPLCACPVVPASSPAQGLGAEALGNPEKKEACSSQSWAVFHSSLPSHSAFLRSQRISTRFALLHHFPGAYLQNRNLPDVEFVLRKPFLPQQHHLWPQQVSVQSDVFETAARRSVESQHLGIATD